MIQWFSKNEKKATATIYSTNITINKVGMEMISNAYAVLLGIDKENSLIAIHPINKDEYDMKQYPIDQMFVLSGGKTYTRISSTEFVLKVASFLKCDFKECQRKYDCYYDDKQGLFFIDLKKELV